MTDQPRLALTFEDVLLVPRRSSIRSRRHVSTRSRFTRGVELAIPIVSANMDTVTTAPMAIAMAELGGLGVLHRFLPVDAQAEEVRRVKRYLGQVIEQPYTIGPERTVAEAAAEAGRLGVTGLVVVDPERRPVGILTARDMRAAAGETVAAAMTPAVRLVTAQPGIDLTRPASCRTATIEKLPLVGTTAGWPTGSQRDIGLRDRWPQATRDGQGRPGRCALGVRGGYLERAGPARADVDALVADVARHGTTPSRRPRAQGDWPDSEVVAGNVATADGFRDLPRPGPTPSRSGSGPARRTTRVAGVGVPQLTAILD
jgi:IMP dehydrogenase